MATEPKTEIDVRYGDPEAQAIPWDEGRELLEQAELYWLTTIRPEGRPHVAPLIGVWDDGAFHFCTGEEERKYRNLASNAEVAVTTGGNAWARGTDVVVEGQAVPVRDERELQRLAAAWEDKYGEVWHFDVADGAFAAEGHSAVVFRVEPRKVFGFGKSPHSQTRWTFS
jgi:nitroimidazol reductase NimA-like FMN-containing flavoprotein (pyridoxamine 5'-phosphate oxidase superfamily)